jgi:serine/threonine protein phosphatase 1
MKRYFAIGDIHGCVLELQKIYKVLKTQAKLNPKEDTLVFLGDYVDGGYNTKGVIDQLMKWNKQYPHWIFLMGNHEHMLLDAMRWNGRVYHSWDLWWGQGGKKTAESYYPVGLSEYERAIAQPQDFIDPKHLDWMEHLLWWYEIDKYFFVHGGLTPGKTISENIDSAQFREDMLWIRDEFYDSDYDFGKTIIFGHTPAKEPIIRLKKIGIDTMTRFGGHLTALELPKKKIYTTEALNSPFF